MKKIQAAAMLPLFALASCGTATQTPVEEVTMDGNLEVTDETTTDVEVNVETEEVPMNEEVSMVETTVESDVQTIEINAPYALPNGQQVSFTATLKVLNGFVVEVSGLEDKMWTQISFAEAFPNAILGKELKGLQIDAISGASLTTMAVNQFLNTVNQ